MNFGVCFTKKVTSLNCYASNTSSLNLDPEKDFFVNASGQPLSRIQNSPGSLLEKIGQVVGIEDLNVTHLRSAMEKVIQDEEDTRGRSSVLNYHSHEVGEDHYLNERPNLRAQFINKLDKKESPIKKPKTFKRFSSFDKAREERKRLMEMEDREASKKNALAILDANRDRKQRNAKYGLRCNILPNHRSFLQSMVYENVFMSDNVPNFPKGNIIKGYQLRNVPTGWMTAPYISD